MSLRKELWTAGEESFAAIADHPIPRGIWYGELPKVTLARLVAIDSLHLVDFARALSLIAAKAPTLDDLAHYAGIALGAARSAGPKRKAMLDLLREDPAAPEGERPYGDFLIAAGRDLGYPEALAAVLPRLWFHAELGKEMQRRSSPDPVYRSFIALHLHKDYLSVVESTLSRVDALEETLAEDERAAMASLFARGARFEWSVWESAQ
ncbi:thiaminase/transcriptional activator TenA [Nonomuraea polychroma]|uniref:Thiaminase/transcriptional activator TenA n=1 Tax=Nonomuraea polychroma TaxID=46176 RepID=A0A438MEV4_9ACTN|nr:hypothetical protein [Nonomuraea polychroma]RVX44148.1 thiaminase/transcriptional activator TenA [Nonomuraea polychroma]